MTARVNDVDMEHVYIYATITDRWQRVEADVYAGCVPAWAWADAEYRAIWKRSRRKLLVDERTADGRGWRVTFTLGTGE